LKVIFCSGVTHYVQEFLLQILFKNVVRHSVLAQASADLAANQDVLAQWKNIW